MGLKLQQVKALPKVGELFEKNWLSAILLSDKPPAKYERNLERNVDCRSLTSNIPHFRHFCLPQA